MTSLADRLRWVIETGKVESARAWCLAAGVAGSYLGTFFARLRAGQPSDMGISVLERLAKAAHISFVWLAVGAGAPEDDLLPAMPPQLRALALRRGAYPEALLRQAAIAVELTGEKDFTEEQWEGYLDDLRKGARHLGLEAAAARLDGRGMKR